MISLAIYSDWQSAAAEGQPDGSKSQYNCAFVDETCTDLPKRFAILIVLVAHGGKHQRVRFSGARMVIFEFRRCVCRDLLGSNIESSM